jgi:hypothetical protein
MIGLVLGSGLLHQAMGQDQVNIRNADLIEAGRFEGDRVQKILGNVHLESEELEMFCDSAYKFVNKDEIRAFGNIQINTESEKIWADTLIYFTEIDFSQLRGRVIIETDTTTLFGNSVDYRFSTKVAHFLDEIRLEDQRGTLLANSGFYYREADSAEFRGEVQLADSMQYLEGDSLFSNRSTDYYELYGDIFGDDRKNNTMIKGHYLESDSTGRRLLKEEAWLMNFESEETDTARTDTTIAQTDTTATPITPADTTGFRPDSIMMPPDSLITDTLISPPDTINQPDTTFTQPDTTTSQPDTTHIRAETILLEENQSPTDTSSTVNGYGNVRIWSTDFSAVSDTSKYVDSTQTFELWSNSIAWHDQVQLTGPYIKAILRSGNIDSLVSYPTPFSVQEDTTINRLNQITGDTLQADFENGNLSEIFVHQNAHLLRFTKNEQDSADGAIDITATSIRILFKNGEIDSLLALGGGSGAINGSYLPESPETAKHRLDGFAWNPDLRPQRPKEKMERRFPPISDEPFFELPRRYIEYLRKNHPDNPYLIQTQKSQ